MQLSLLQYLWHQSRTYSQCPATRCHTNQITPLCDYYTPVFNVIGDALYTDICIVELTRSRHASVSLFYFCWIFFFTLSISLGFGRRYFAPLHHQRVCQASFSFNQTEANAHKHTLTQTDHIINKPVNMLNTILLAHRWQTPNNNNNNKFTRIFGLETTEKNSFRYITNENRNTNDRKHKHNHHMRAHSQTNPRSWKSWMQPLKKNQIYCVVSLNWMHINIQILIYDFGCSAIWQTVCPCRKWKPITMNTYEWGILLFFLFMFVFVSNITKPSLTEHIRPRMMITLNHLKAFAESFYNNMFTANFLLIKCSFAAREPIQIYSITLKAKFITRVVFKQKNNVFHSEYHWSLHWRKHWEIYSVSFFGCLATIFGRKIWAILLNCSKTEQSLVNISFFMVAQTTVQTRNISAMNWFNFPTHLVLISSNYRIFRKCYSSDHTTDHFLLAAILFSHLVQC